jgi:hypothetical protein
VAAPKYESRVFINCPFDDDYKPMVEAIVLAINDCSFMVRHALELASRFI